MSNNQNNDQEISEINITIDMGNLRRGIKQMNNSLASLGNSFKSSRFLTVKTSRNQNFINIDDIVNNTEIELPTCPNCNIKRKEKIGILIRNKNVLCICKKTKFIAKQQG